MKPPICAICNKRFDISEENCGLIYFRQRKSDIEWDKKMKKTGAKGHPPYARWFCTEHYTKAKEFQNFVVDKAIPEIRKLF